MKILLSKAHNHWHKKYHLLEISEIKSINNIIIPFYVLLYIWHFSITFQGIILTMLVENRIMRTLNSSRIWHIMNNVVMEPVASVSIPAIQSNDNPMPFIDMQQM